MSTSAVSTLPTASDPALATELASLEGFDSTHKSTLDQTDFLKILATQMANQNPLEPTDDTQTIAQMATFSSISQMSDLVTSLKSFIVTQDFATAQNMLGKYVTVTTDETTTDADGKTTTEAVTTSGIVSAVGYDEDGVSIITIGDKTFSPSDVTEIRNEAPTTTTDS